MRRRYWLHWRAFWCCAAMGVATLALCRFASSWSHTSARVTGLQPFTLVSTHSRHTRHWSHHRISGGDCTASHDPTNRPYRMVRPRAAGPSVSCASPPLGQLPRTVCAGDLPLSCDPTKVFICPLASHLQRLGSSRHGIPTQHSSSLRPQLTCASITSSIFRRTAFFTDLPVD